MSELKPCPFCGASTEMAQRLYPAMRKTTCKSKEEAEKAQKGFENLGVVANSIVYERERRNRGKWAAVVELWGFIPRCTNIHCPGRSTVMFKSPGDAISAWNRRDGDV